jgi:cardiolipin synthase
VSAVPARPGAVAAPAVIERALDRATGARAIPGNALRHVPDSARALDLMLERIGGARAWVHFENYIIRSDRTGRRFAAALAERARAGVAVRVLYDALGSFGTRRRLWRDLRAAGADVRAFNPLRATAPLHALRRDHRKLLVVDGTDAVVGGICIGDEWAGDPARRRQPWRDTAVELRGPAAIALDRAFARSWAHAGPPLDRRELAASVPAGGPSWVRVVEGVPGRSRTYRAEQLLAAGVSERLWITDAYLVAPPPLYASLIDAARGGVDVRLLLPGSTDIPLVRALTRVGYRDLLRAGVRIFEWRGPMIHAKTMLADRQWVRIGSSNLNPSSLLANYELDVLVECDRLAEELAAQYRHDLAWSREILLRPRRLAMPPRLVTADAPALPAPDAAPPPPHARSVRERRAAAAITLLQVAGGLRRAIAGVVALGLVGLGVLLLVFPDVMSVVLAAGALWLGGSLGWYAVARRGRSGGAAGAGDEPVIDDGV